MCGSWKEDKASRVLSYFVLWFFTDVLYVSLFHTAYSTRFGEQHHINIRHFLKPSFIPSKGMMLETVSSMRGTSTGFNPPYLTQSRPHVEQAVFSTHPPLRSS
jgi:hypothetical protein